MICKNNPLRRKDILEVREFKQKLKPYKAVIGFDYGSKRLGVAVSDLLLTVATPYKIIQRTNIKEDLAEIRRVIEEKEAGGIVFGLPLQMNGEEGGIAKEVREFAARLEKQVNLPTAFWDERLSSSAMENFLIKEADMSRKKRAKVLDSSAAAFILQGYLDALRYV